jgi:hypothetical protein
MQQIAHNESEAKRTGDEDYDEERDAPSGADSTWANEDPTERVLRLGWNGDGREGRSL